MGRRRLLLGLCLLAPLGLLGQPTPTPIPAAARDALSAQLDRIYNQSAYKEKKFGPFQWLEGGKAYTTVEPSAGTPKGKDIVRYDSATGARRVLVPAASLVPAAGQTPLDPEEYSWSADGRKLLIFTNTRKVWRKNTRGDYWVLDVASGKLQKLGAGKPEASLMFAKFSPDGTRVAYVQANDLWVEDLASGKITRLTSDGGPTTVNGTADWVYEEEFEVRDGFRWSPNGQDIAFWHFDATGINEFSLINDTDTQYPVVTRIAYPKAGTTNSAVKIGVVSAGGGATPGQGATPPVPPIRWIALPGDPRQMYVPRMEYVDFSGEIVLQQMNRLQNTIDVWLVDPATAKARKMLHDEDRAWLDVVDSWQWLPGKELLWVSEGHGWRHAYAAPRDGANWRLLTPGDFDIETVEGVDEKGEFLYFIASPGDATRRYLYRARLDGRGTPQRLTPADQPGTHSYDVSPDGRYAVRTVSTIDRPPVTDFVQLPDHKTLRVLEDNKELAAAVAPVLTPATEFFQVDIGGGVTLDGWMIKPRNFDPSKKYPLLMYVYGEPAGVEVTDKWRGDPTYRMLFHRALADAGYVVACVDNRGTPSLKGRDWRKSIYGEVGVLATADQTAAVRAMLASRPYLDPERVASWGWSGGGSMTLNLLFRSPDLYKVGMSVAPVPDQTLYDTIYQERYMGLPAQNAEGYRNGSPIFFAEGLRGKLLLVHGSGDDNVHYQGSERLVNRLVVLGKPFDFMVYPNRTHSINEGEGTSYHLHALLARHLRENLRAGPK
ncbi:MAG: S9 family peptidase [Thermoanaerobaculia bacterium]